MVYFFTKNLGIGQKLFTKYQIKAPGEPKENSLSRVILPKLSLNRVSLGPNTLLMHEVPSNRKRVKYCRKDFFPARIKLRRRQRKKTCKHAIGDIALVRILERHQMVSGARKFLDRIPRRR